MAERENSDLEEKYRSRLARGGEAAESRTERGKRKHPFCVEEGNAARTLEKTGTKRQGFCLHSPSFLRNPLIAQIAILL